MPNHDKQILEADPPLAGSVEPNAEAFPSARYFQIHFEFLQEQLQSLLSQQQALQRQMQRLETYLTLAAQGKRAQGRLDRLLAGHGAADNGASATPGKR
jgi:hypothetical protein